MHYFPFHLFYEMEEEVEEESGRAGGRGGGRKRLAAGGSASPPLEGGREWKLGAQAYPGTLVFILQSQLTPILSHLRAQHDKKMGRSWGCPLLGAVEVALKSPKTRAREAGSSHPQLAEVGASDLSVNKPQVNQAHDQIYGSSPKGQSHVKFKSSLLSGALPDPPDSPGPGPPAVLLLPGDRLMPPASPIGHGLGTGSVARHCAAGDSRANHTSLGCHILFC